MNKIVTIGREFGSGGREFGKRLAETLGIAYYDSEIVTAIAQRSSLAEEYVNQVLEQRIRTYYPITVATTLSVTHGDALYSITKSIYAAQTEIIRELADKGDCVIVGRCADHILADRDPMRIFLYADMASRIARCRSRGEDTSRATDRELEKKILSVDRARGQYYRFYTGKPWGDKLNYDLCINASGLDLKTAAGAVATMLRF